MSTFQLYSDLKGEIIYSNFPYNLEDLLARKSDNTNCIEYPSTNGKLQKARLGSLQNEHGIVYLLSVEPKYINSSKLFKELLNANLLALTAVVNFKNTFSLNQNEYVQGLVHNLTSLNSYNIQELNSLIPQKSLTQNFNKQHDVVRKIISEQPNVAVDTFLKLIKYNYAMKVEFSVFEKTVMKNPSVQKIESPIRDIVLSILQIFIDDFEKEGIIVSVDFTNKLLFVDYDSIFVSLYYLLENALKYCAKRSKFKIHFNEDGANFYIVFDMVSIRIEEEEITKLCTKNYRSVNAVNLMKDGKGIGMHRILKTLRLNHAELEIKPRISDHKITAQNHTWEHNEFRIKFDSTRVI